MLQTARVSEKGGKWTDAGDRLGPSRVGGGGLRSRVPLMSVVDMRLFERWLRNAQFIQNGWPAECAGGQ